MFAIPHPSGAPPKPEAVLNPFQGGFSVHDIVLQFIQNTECSAWSVRLCPLGMGKADRDIAGSFNFHHGDRLSAVVVVVIASWACVRVCARFSGHSYLPIAWPVTMVRLDWV